MPRSFQIVEDKLEEAEFFLEKLRFRDTDFPKFNIKEASFYLSAFLSACRSVTFCLQASLAHLDTFQSWYDAQQAKLRDSELARFFLEARNLSQKVGYYPLRGARVHRDKTGAPHVDLYFDFEPSESISAVPQSDVLTACEAHFRQLLQIAIDCYKTFGRIIDPEQYYTVENMQDKGLTLENFEAELGLEKGWTDHSGLPLEHTVELLRHYAPKISIDWIFHKYLGTDRYGAAPTSSDA